MKKWIIIIILLVLGGALYGAFRYLNTRPIERRESGINTKGLVSLGNWIMAKQSEADINLVKKKEQELAEEITILAVGDIMLSRNVGATMIKHKDYHYPFLKLQALISVADLAFGNLESPIESGAPVKTGSFSFRADPETAEGLRWAGFDVLSLANNHILNQGPDGLMKTFGYLNTHGIDYCGAGSDARQIFAKTAIREVKGRKIMFLCYAYGPDNYAAGEDAAGMAMMDEKQLAIDLQKAKEKADFIIISMHDGVEYKHKSAAHQQAFARQAIDNGADLVIGHHPHVVQEVEQYKGKYIFYSLGNFVFDQMWSEATRQGLAVKITLSKDEVKKVEYFPVMIEDYSQPRLAEGKEAEEIMRFVEAGVEKVN